uniref:KH domain-containing protein n=1 Tax=Ascaris lumbricoides TaxID=6252 RepID=A0A0M3IER4_ASCLU
MDFPLYVHTYELNGRIYRRNPYRGFRSEEEAELRGGDTADLYADDDEYDDFTGAVKMTHNVESSEEVHESEVNSSACVWGPLLGSDGSIGEGTKVGNASCDNDDDEKTLCSSTVGNRDVGDTAETGREESAIKFDPRSKKWSTRLEIPYEMIRFVIGVKGSMKRRLEVETDCRLIFPEREKKAKYIDIVSTKSQESIERCRDRIELMVMGTRERSAFTHFVSLPMNHADIQTAFTQFAELVQNDDELPASCREPAVFQEAGKLHLTVVMLSLLDENEKTKAANALEAVVNNRAKKIVDGVPMEVELRGLEYMNDDPTRVRVLYAKAYSEKLQEVANVIADGIGDAGLAPRRSERVKVHCTLMNTRYAIEKGKENDAMDVEKLMQKYGEFFFGHVSVSEIEKGKENDAMDVEKLMQKYGEFFFGHVSVSEVHLSSRVDPKDENGFYACVASFKLC